MVIYISTPQDLYNIRNNLSGEYELTNDIDMSSFGNFIPIGNGLTTKFKGKLDGKGFKIKNLTINSASTYTGLFTSIDTSGIVRNINFENVNIKSSSNNIGAVAGYISGSSSKNATVENIKATGKIEGTYNVSSIVGANAGTIQNCYSEVKLIATHTSYPSVFGIANSESSLYDKITNCIFNGTAEIKASNAPTITISPITREQMANTLQNCYYNSDRITPANYPVEKSIGLTTSQFADSSNFNLNTSIWGFAHVPYLLIFGIPSLPAQQVTMNINSHLNVISNSVDVSKRKVIVNVSSIEKINSRALKNVLKHVTSHVESILSTIDISNANIKTYNVNSYLKSINSTIHITKDGTKKIKSYIEPIQSFVEVIIPVSDKEVFANVYIIENQSNIKVNQNQSYSFIIENPTRLKVK